MVIPVLRFVFGVSPTVVSGTSLLFVVANVLSSSLGYIRQKRVDFGVSVPLALGGVPGSLLGVFFVHRVSARWFDLAYGCILLTLFVLVLRRRAQTSRPAGERTFAHNWAVAISSGVVLGVLSSLFGIGGGIVLVPLLLIAARMPPHIVSATSGFVVLCTAPVGVIAHALAGDIDWSAGAPLIAGGLVGGAIAPSIAKRTSSPTLVTLLAIALIVAAASLVLKHL